MTTTPRYHYSNEQKITQKVLDLDLFQVLSTIKTLKKYYSPVKTFLERKSNIYIFGAGGTTSWFLPKLLKIYNDAFNKNPSLAYPLNIVLIDGDEVETKNILRQNFISQDVNSNKAQVLSERYSDLYDNITVSFIPKYATYSSFDADYLPDNSYPEDKFVAVESMGIKPNSIMINLVDNEGFKKKLDTFSSSRSILTFSAGVNLFNGQAYYSLYDDYSSGYVQDHPDLKDIFDEVSIHACADADANGTDDNPEQMFNGNDMAASILANLFQTVLNDIPLYKKIEFNTGVGVSASTSLVSYSLLLHSLLSCLRSTHFINTLTRADAYVRRFGLHKQTSTAKHNYQAIKDKEILLSFYKMLIQV